MELTVYLEVQSRCNAKCPMCLSWQNSESLAPDVVVRALDSLAANGWRHVIFTGGEFVIHPSAMALTDAAVQRCLDISFITNGSFFSLDKSFLQNISRLRSVVYSRDFADGHRHAESRSLPNLDDTIVAAMHYLSRRNVDIQLNTVMMPDHLQEIQMIPTTPFWRFVDSWHIIPVKGSFAYAWTEEKRREAVERLLEAEQRAHDDGVYFTGPLSSGFCSESIANVALGLYTTGYWTDRACLARESLLFIDSFGSVLPCNCSLWDARDAVEYGKLGTSSMERILLTRRKALDSHERGISFACRACDPLNVARHLEALADRRQA